MLQNSEKLRQLKTRLSLYDISRLERNMDYLIHCHFLIHIVEPINNSINFMGQQERVFGFYGVLREP